MTFRFRVVAKVVFEALALLTFYATLFILFS